LEKNIGTVRWLCGCSIRTYKGFPHGMPTTQADTINADLLAFLKA
jgi:non-heme chloroperoxidase